MRVLITGGAGYLGGALTDVLKNHEVRVYDSLLFESDYLKPVPFVLGDVRNKEHLKTQLDWAECVVWLAAIVGDGACALNPEITTEVNQESVRWLSENFEGRIIFMSTCSVYGASDEELNEDSKTSPLSVYAQTKLEAEKYLKGKALIFRLGTLFGIGDDHSRIRLDLAVNTMTYRALGGQLRVFGGEQWRPLLHVKDAARAIAEHITTPTVGTYNLYSQNIKMIDLARSIQRYIPCDLQITDMKFEDLRNYRVSSKSKFKPIYSIEDGIKEIKSVLEERRIKHPESQRYTNVGHLGGAYGTQVN